MGKNYPRERTRKQLSCRILCKSSFIKAPLKEGIYQFKIIYKKAGYTYIKHAERVTIRPYKHDEFERFLFVAYPYTFGTFATIISTFIFVVLYIYSGRVEKSKQE
jgi:oligosaccharyltransferase complex subunit beta